MPEVHKFYETRGVGLAFRGEEAKAVAAMLMAGDKLDLEREPDNEHDAYAIKVLQNDTHICYIARDVAAFMATYLDEGGWEVDCTYDHTEQKGRAVHLILDIVLTKTGEAAA